MCGLKVRKSVYTSKQELTTNLQVGKIWFEKKTILLKHFNLVHPALICTAANHNYHHQLSLSGIEVANIGTSNKEHFGMTL